MMKTFRIGILRFRSDNRKSKTCTEPFDSDQDKLRRSSDDLKWLGLPVIAFVLAMFCAVAQAQQPKKVTRLGYLSSFDAATESARSEAIRLALREFGYIEGQNIATEYRYAEGKLDRFPELAAELVRLKVDIIVISGGAGTVRAANNATKTIPIVIAGLPVDPVEAGLVESLARPGGNVTGLSILSRELAGKRLELLKETVPKLARVAVLYDPAVAELVRLKVDIIVVAGGIGTIQAFKNVTKTIPIVMVGLGSDPVESGLVESLARPGGNITGITNLSRDLGGKRLELLKEAVPKVTRVAVLYDPTVPTSVIEVKEVLPITARALRLTLQSWEVRAAEDFDRVFAAMGKERPDGLYVPVGGALMFANGKRIAGFALKSRLPSVYDNRESVDAGGLMYYGADLADSYRRVATYVDRILKGAKPADLPVEQPSKFELVINLRTAKQIGLAIPNSVLARADRVIK